MADSVPGDPSSQVMLPINSSLDGAIETAGDHDWYRLNLTAGIAYTLETSLSGTTDFDTLITLRGATGAYITSNDDGGTSLFSKLVYTPTTSGTFFIDVGSYDNVATGAFRVTASAAAVATSDTIASSTQTTATLAVGASTQSTIDTTGDHDWFQVKLVAGETYHFWTGATGGSSDVDTVLALRDSTGLQLASNDDSTGLYSAIGYTAAKSGTYYLDVGGSASKTGAYQVSLASDTTKPIFTDNQIAAQLTTGYWGGTSHKFNISTGGTLTVNLTGLTDDGKALAREALTLWTSVSGITFSEVSTGGQILIDDNSKGAATSSTYNSNGTITKSTVNVGTDWLKTYGTTTDSYSLQTFVHEIGHALGLGHAGNYNGDATTPAVALYANDAWNASIMSYFAPSSSPYFSQLGFTDEYVLTPMAADGIAIQNLYGTTTTTRTGDTVYGFHNTSGETVYDAAANPGAAYAIYDNGGMDTLDYSGFSAQQTISLIQESYSSVGGKIGNVQIASGAIIENAIGGSGADHLIGNDAANLLIGGAGDDRLEGGAGDDTLTGGSGADTLTGGSGHNVFLDTAAGLNGDTITDFTFGDQIAITDVSLANFTYSATGTTLTYSGGSLTFSGGTLSAFAEIGGGVGLRLISAAANQAQTSDKTIQNDFDGDGHSDFLWRNANGSVSTWAATGSPHADQLHQSVFNASVSTDWKIVDTMDFNGDGQSDILWRHANGSLSIWDATGGGGFQQGSYNDKVGTDWTISATGDFNGDGKDDLLWHNANGSVSIWSSTRTGFQQNTYSHAPVSTDWKIEGAADFNGDGKSDILWRNDSGALSVRSSTGSGFAEATFSAQVGRDWHMAGLADFDGDGRSDILWRNDNGAVSIWSSNGSGFDQATYNTKIGTDWTIAAVEDFNGDGKADILWRNANGSLSTWESNGHSFDQSIANAQVGNDWSIVGHSSFF